MRPETPELDRMLELAEEYHTQNVSDFLEWLFSQEIEMAICEWGEGPDTHRLFPIEKTINGWIEEWLGIDGAKCEQEHRALLEWMR